ncbi:MAG: sugar ABC transporter substrate-binding protein [Synergistaceae bacterium]|nr:sugar ABC transporter substrate-binding protein [Synergistaceae bacterium]
MRKGDFRFCAVIAALLLFAACFALVSPSAVHAADAKLQPLFNEVTKLSGQDAIDFFKSLPGRGLTDGQILQFFIDLPVSQANPDIYKMYVDEGFEIYAQVYPRGESYGGFELAGGGADFVGPYSGWPMKLPYSEYISSPEGPVGDAGKNYKIAFVAAGMKSAWSTSMHDSIKYEAQRHPNVTVDVYDYEYDNNKLSNVIDNVIAQKVDGIVLWPANEAPSGPPVQRAEGAGIPVVTIDRVAGTPRYTNRCAGNFTANGAQNAMYLLQQLSDEGNYDCNIVLLRKPLGSTADAIRIGYFLKPLSYVPGVKVIQSYFDTSDKPTAFANSQAAIQAHKRIDAVMTDGDYEGVAMLNALQLAGRLKSRPGDKQVIILNVDDSKEAVNLVKIGDIATNAPYTPLMADVGLRVLLKKLTGDPLPQDIIFPNIRIITQDGRTLFGMKTQTPDEWYQFTFGPKI